MSPRPAVVALTALGLPAFFLLNAGFRLQGQGTARLFAHWRAWDDMALAAGYAARGEFPVAPYRVRDQVRRGKDPRFRTFSADLLGRIAQGPVGPMAFWRTLPADTIPLGTGWRVARRFDDSGRALALGFAFKLLGGIAPFLVFWLAALAVVPVLSWTVVEFAAAGRALAGAVFVLVVSSSAFVLDVLLLGYSAAGFHLVSLLTLVPLGVYAVLGQPSVSGLLLRAGVVGGIFGLCALCRGTCLTLVPGMALALALGTRRIASSGGRSPWRGAAVTAAGLGLLLAPYAAGSAWTSRLMAATLERYEHQPLPRYHDMALLVWKGLGDFDRSKGYAFRDKAGEEAIQQVSATGQASRER